jgi:hypothetical protein
MLMSCAASVMTRDDGVEFDNSVGVGYLQPAQECAVQFSFADGSLNAGIYARGIASPNIGQEV